MGTIATNQGIAVKDMSAIQGYKRLCFLRVGLIEMLVKEREAVLPDSYGG